MSPVLPPRADLALDASAVLELMADDLEAWTGWRPEACGVELLKGNDRRLVVRYALVAGEQRAAMVGKWFSTDRGALVYDALRALQRAGLAVPSPIGYRSDARALFMAAIEGPVLRDALYVDQEVAASAGAWLAAFHRSGVDSPRACGPAKMRASIPRWTEEAPGLNLVAPQLDAALARLPDPRLPVHYDFYHSQGVVTGNDDVVIFDLDEAGLGDPAFDLAHFTAHQRLHGIQVSGDPDAFAQALAAFRRGYATVAPLPEARPALDAFAHFKLAWQALKRGAPEPERTLLLDGISAALRAV